MKSHFSTHAFNRVSGRISLKHNEILRLLDSKTYINIGNESGNNKVHKLFFSIIDDLCFVAIQDDKTGTVVTILPIDYHNNIAWMVSFEAQLQAKKEYLEIHKSENEIIKDLDVELNSAVAKTLATKFKITGNVVDPYNNHVKFVSLKSLSSIEHNNKISSLISSPDFLSEITERIKDKDLGCENRVEEIYIKLGKNNIPTIYSLIENRVL